MVTSGAHTAPPICNFEVKPGQTVQGWQQAAANSRKHSYGSFTPPESPRPHLDDASLASRSFRRERNEFTTTQKKPVATPPMSSSVVDEFIEANAKYAASFTKGSLPLPPGRKVAGVCNAGGAIVASAAGGKLCWRFFQCSLPSCLTIREPQPPCTLALARPVSQQFVCVAACSAGVHGRKAGRRQSAWAGGRGRSRDP
jgi:hypothetical protein